MYMFVIFGVCVPSAWSVASSIFWMMLGLIEASIMLASPELTCVFVNVCVSKCVTVSVCVLSVCVLSVCLVCVFLVCVSDCVCTDVSRY